MLKPYEALPQKYPFLMIDKVIEVDHLKYCKSLKNVSINEPYFQGHFPDHPMVPGVLLIEMCLQNAQLIFMPMEVEQNSSEYEKGQRGYVVMIDKFKFKTPVYPGDQLIIESRIDLMGHQMAKVKCVITKDDNITVAKGMVSVVLPQREEN
jgi:3-hydroxyacyl-[acyl-carrier-protein] dehydratase